MTHQLILPGLDPVPFTLTAEYKKLWCVKLLCPVCFPVPVKLDPESSFWSTLWTSRKDGQCHYECSTCHWSFTMPGNKHADQVWPQEIMAKLNRQWGREKHIYDFFSGSYKPIP